LRIRRRSACEQDTTEAASVLVRLVRDLAISGDTIGGASVATSFFRLLDIHLAHTRTGASGEEGKLAPAIPALRVSVGAAIDGLATATTPGAREVMREILERIVAASGPGEACIAMVAVQIEPLLDKDELRTYVSTILMSCARKAIEIRDKDGMALLQSLLQRHARLSGTPQGYVFEAATYLVVSSVWLDYFEAAPRWRWYWSLAVDNQGQPSLEALLGSIRIGSAAILAAELSIALEVVLALRDARVDLSHLEELVKEPSVRTREQFASDIGGRYLGKDVEAAERRFARFAVAMQSSLR
jgi:hypothetical protein